MIARGISEDALEGAAEKALGGDKSGAASALVSALTVAYTGHPLLAALLGRGAQWFVTGVIEQATARLLLAEHQYDQERERVLAMARAISAELLPFWTDSVDELSAQSREQFLQLLNYVDRNLASATGQGELLNDVRELSERVRALSNHGGARAVVSGIDRLSYSRRCFERWGQLTRWPSATTARGGGTESNGLIQRFVPQHCSVRRYHRAKNILFWSASPSRRGS